jgi:5,5'-dehydrodivanillate O-demethylase
MLTKEDNERFTRVGPGTPGGEMLRRYWWPIAFSDEVKGPRPKKVRLLGEDFVLFRDGSGRVGMLEPHCAHRRVSLQHGRVEKDGLRCCFHGWLWDARGRCLEQPCEDPVRNSKDKVQMASFSTQEAGGLVFAYIGPLPAPELPKYDLLVHESGIRYVWGFTDWCNWLQSAEQAADPAHLAWLHAGPYPIYAAKRTPFEIQRRDYGFDYSLEAAGVEDKNVGSVIFPAHNRFASGRTEQALGSRQNMLFRTPADDTESLNFFITLYPRPDGGLVQHTETPPEQAERGPWIPTQRGVYPAGDEEWWGVESMMQDRMALESQGPVHDRSKEHLAASDRGVALLREMLRTSIDAVEKGGDPVGIIRDPAKNKIIEFGTYLHKFAPPLPSLADPVAG